MTTKKEYFCNLCGDPISPDATSSGEGSGWAVKFMSFPDGKKFTLTRNMWATDNHICFNCVYTIRKFKSISSEME